MLLFWESLAGGNVSLELAGLHLWGEDRGDW